MIDIEPQVFTAVAEALRDQFPGILVSGAYTPAPAQFPFVSVEESGTSVLQRGQDNTTNENFSWLTYELNVCTNTSQKKSDAKRIREAADAVMASMGFTRTFCQPVPNMSDATVYRIVMRYTGAVNNKTQAIVRR